VPRALVGVVDLEDGTRFTEIELVVESDGDVRDAAKLTNTVASVQLDTAKEKTRE